MDQENPIVIEHQLELAKAKALALYGERELADAWLNEPNPVFYERAPREVILAGEGDSVLDLLDQRLMDRPSA